MRLARWRWVLVVVVVTAGCVSGAPPGLPASFTVDLRDGGWTFTAASPGPDAMSSAAIVADLRRHQVAGAFLGTRAIPIYGYLGCKLVACQVSGAAWGTEPGSVWLILYPDSAVPGSDIGWALVDGATGYALNRHVVHRPEPRP